MASGPPRVFVSSTVFDFRDLRSALKFWLAELGYDAQLSEYNDFAKPLDTNSFDACLCGVESADYFVLLIGSRVGGLFNETERISITRQEYRRAYECFVKTGKPRIVTFVRADVWTVREDRRGLESLIKHDDEIQREVPPNIAARITSHSSRTINDAASIFDFLDEVKRKDEMMAAAANGAGFPAGNWIHVFNDFADLVAVLRRDIRAGSIRRASIETNLRGELVAIADALTMQEKAEGGVHALREYVAPLRERLGTDFNGVVHATGAELARVAGFGMMAGACAASMTTSAIDEALRSGEFLDWKPEVNAFVPSPLHRALVRLRDEIARLRRSERLDTPTLQGPRAEWLTNWRPRAAVAQEVVASELIPYFAVHDRHENILVLSAAIHAAIDGKVDALGRLRLWSSTPLGAKKGPLHAGVGKRVRLAMWLGEQADEIANRPESDPTDGKPIVASTPDSPTNG